MRGDGSYRGDIDAKRLARYDYWRGVRGWMGDDFTSSRHLVLASEYGGDISTLLGMGVASENIFAVDIDPVAAERCRLKFAGVDVVADDVESVIRRRPRGYFGSIFLDFCSWFTPAVRRRCAAAALHVPPGGVFGVGVMRGREGKAFTRARVPMARKVSAKAKSMGCDRPLWVSRNVKPTSLPANDGRGGLIYEAIQNDIMAARRLAIGVTALTYQNGRTPMMYRAFGIETPGPLSRKSFVRYCERRISTVLRARSDAYRLSAVLGRELLAHVEVLGRSRPISASMIHWDSDRGGCVDMARAANECGDDAAACLNVSRGTLAAWRAHATMGTYDSR